MLQENEVVMLASGLAVLAFALGQRRRLSRIPGWHWLLAGYCLLLCSWTATVLEGIVLPDALNTVEHATQAAGFVLFAGWCWRHLRRDAAGADA